MSVMMMTFGLMPRCCPGGIAAQSIGAPPVGSGSSAVHHVDARYLQVAPLRPATWIAAWRRPRARDGPPRRTGGRRAGPHHAATASLMRAKAATIYPR